MSLKAVILVACLVLTLVNGQSHIINDCLNPGTSPTVLYDQQVSKQGSFLQVQEETLRIPTVGFSPSALTCVTVLNLDSDANGGYPTILEGGVGGSYVTLDLKSRLGKGFDFRVTVYYDKNATVTI